MTEFKQFVGTSVLKRERQIQAHAVSRGIGIGRVVFFHDEKRRFFRIDLRGPDLEAEVKRLHSAVNVAVSQLNQLSRENSLGSNQPVSGIFGVHLLIVEESSLIEKIEQVIRDQQVNTEWALKIVSDQYREKQITVHDPHLREKYLDIEDVAERIRKALGGWQSPAQLAYSGAVVVAREMRPSSILELTKSNPTAIITERGGWTSHASILAREFKLPMVSGIKDLATTFSDGDSVIVDGVNGLVILNPLAGSVERFRSFNTSLIYPADRGSIARNPCVTLDSTPIVIRANVDVPEAYRIANAMGADGIGLFRSESLLSRTGIISSEDEQFAAYRQIAEAAGAAGVKVRTFDIGIDQLNGNGTSPERNPSLGMRSIRLSLSEPTHFRTQIRAILRASAGQNIDIVLPMISGVAEIDKSRAIINEERSKLESVGMMIGEPKLGAMIEVPSAVMTAREIAGKVDFLCLGTNDLVQYLLAVDRDNDAVADLYQSLHPAVLRSIGEVILAARTANIPVVVCGEMAGSPFYVPLLIALGARELSMNVYSVEQVHRLISGITVKACSDLFESLSPFETADDIEASLRSFYLENWSGLFPAGLLDSKHR